jgi:hypothetical protein
VPPLERTTADRLDSLDPVSRLEMHQSVSQAQESFGVTEFPLFRQVLARQIKHGGDCAEIVIFLDVELHAYFVQELILQRGS